MALDFRTAVNKAIVDLRRDIQKEFGGSDFKERAGKV
jgi:hypothetical protein